MDEKKILPNDFAVPATRTPPAPGRQGHRPGHRLDQPWDVVVLGGGNAALVSALTAADHGARVLLLERAPAVFRGGNSRHTRNVLVAYLAALMVAFAVAPYTKFAHWLYRLLAIYKHNLDPPGR